VSPVHKIHKEYVKLSSIFISIMAPQITEMLNKIAKTHVSAYTAG